MEDVASVSKSLNRRYLFVSGKGGVGKSLMAAAVAIREAKAGVKTLLVETGDRSYFRDFLDLPVVDHQPRASGLGFDIALWSGESCLREYVLHLLKLERLYKIFFENKVMRALVRVAPGLSEIAILGKITSGVRRVGPRLNYDTIVVDMPATGHALAMFRAPRGMADAIQIGPMALHCNEMDKLVRDGRSAGLILVSLLEELPVAETIEFAKTMEREFKMPARVVANRVADFPLSETELQGLAALGRGELSDYAKGLLQQQQLQAQQKQQLQSGVTGEIVFVPRYYSLEPRQMIEKSEEALRTLSMPS